VARAMTIAIRVAGKEEGEGVKEMALATRVAGERMATARKKVMAMKRRQCRAHENNLHGYGG
jgi:hypothetical protein